MSGTTILAYIILALTIGYAFVYPGVGDVSNLMVQKTQYENSLATVSNIETRKKQLLADFNNIPNQDKKNMEIILPNSFDYVRLVSQIDNVASKNGISIKNINTANVDSSVGDTIAEAGAPRAYQAGVISFSFEATYDNFRKFIKNMEESLRILDVRSVEVKTGEKGVYNYEIEFETYWLE